MRAENPQIPTKRVELVDLCTSYVQVYLKLTLRTEKRDAIRLIDL